jgi:hypothetical protein
METHSRLAAMEDDLVVCPAAHVVGSAVGRTVSREGRARVGGVNMPPQDKEFVAL